MIFAVARSGETFFLAAVPPSPRPAGRSLREARPSVAAGVDGRGGETARAPPWERGSTTGANKKAWTTKRRYLIPFSYSSGAPPARATCSGLMEAALNFLAEVIIFSSVASKDGFSPLWKRSGLM